MGFNLLIKYVKDFFGNYKMVLELAKNDFHKRYLESYLGIFWAFVQPTITILIFWFVFQVGFRSAPVEEVPFILWLITGIVPWFYFSDALNSCTGSILESSYLVKKVIFRVSYLPIIKLLSALIIHLFFIFIIIFMFLLYGYGWHASYIQVFYYLMAMTLLLLGVGLITSSLVIFIKDITHIVAMLIQFGFWLTPIFWSIKLIPEEYKNLLILNPMYYIIEGYRSTFISHEWFWDKPGLTLYFWIVTLMLLSIGGFLYKKLKPHFADVL
ncbi:ABC transporter permease [Paenibacillus thiaminolyticus]|uniref:ABC transporter permease n=1 Tax=Paenibacillus thiaminolyticus TaxID=49283 RepID=UPI0023312298|nr:ABC transporter permease [Paenibacillus thiaminolyticus]WCF07875.1 ABC transporter permease [Paenibacillus thiaminolyticus]